MAAEAGSFVNPGLGGLQGTQRHPMMKHVASIRAGLMPLFSFVILSRATERSEGAR
jgi:hypothetical protein